MNRHRLAAISLAAGLSLACTGFAQASPIDFHPPIHAMFSKAKMVKLSLRNASGTDIELRMGDNVVTLPSGKTQSFSLAPGTRIIANSATKTYAEGALLAEVSTSFDGATIVLH